MAKARIVMTDGTTYELATALAQRPAAIHFKDAKGKERVVELNAVQQISFEHDQVLVQDAHGNPVAVAAEEYKPKVHGKAISKRRVLRGPLEGDIATLPVHPAR